MRDVLSRTSGARSAPYHPIEDYAVIGDLHTVALVGRNGSIDWCCLPRFDSPSVFGALLDTRKGGFFRIAPRRTPGMRQQQRYVPETNVLLTRFLTGEGLGEITDFMPIKPTGSDEHEHHLVRSVAVVRGSLSFELVCRPAFNYARDAHIVHLSEWGAVFSSECFSLALASPIPLEADEDGSVRATFTLHAGQSVQFLLESASAHDRAPVCPSTCAYEETLEATIRYWRTWIAQCQYQGRWRELVQRSALVLKLLTYAPTGAMVAAPTTSLPEQIGGTRNWDYRYTWLRDASFTLESLLTLGLTQEAEAFMGWLTDCCYEVVRQGTVQPLYRIDGGRDLSEETLDHLEGYRHSAPVRIGNGAAGQYQVDVYGELLDAVYLYHRYQPLSPDLWEHLLTILAWLQAHWQDPDEGIWEVRGGPQPFVHSRLMSWVAFDRALRMARQCRLPAPVEAWKHTRALIYQEMMDRGWNERTQSFVQSYGSDAVDASALLMVLTRFARATDPRMLLTIDRIQRELTSDARVYRYDPHTAADDGMGSREGAFSPCSFWLAEALARAGRVEEARLLLEKMLSYANHVGLFAEEIGPAGEALGNFPQAFTHLALISACVTIDRALNAKRQRSDDVPNGKVTAPTGPGNDVCQKIGKERCS